MSISRETLITKAKGLAQDPNAGSPVLLDGSHYQTAIDQAVDDFQIDKPNRRIFHYTAIASTFRFVLFGTGKITPASGLDVWVDGGTWLDAVYVGYDTAANTNAPIDRATWRVRREPGPLEVLELLDELPAIGEVLRLEYLRPHVVHESTPASSSILEADVPALVLLTAAKICYMAAVRYAQNTGTSTFQADQVDRRTQSDVMRSRAKDLMDQYAARVGRGGVGGESAVAAVGLVRRLSLDTSHQRGRLWNH